MNCIFLPQLNLCHLDKKKIFILSRIMTKLLEFVAWFLFTSCTRTSDWCCHIRGVKCVARASVCVCVSVWVSYQLVFECDDISNGNPSFRPILPHSINCIAMTKEAIPCKHTYIQPTVWVPVSLIVFTLSLFCYENNVICLVSKQFVYGLLNCDLHLIYYCLSAELNSKITAKILVQGAIVDV